MKKALKKFSSKHPKLLPTVIILIIALAIPFTVIISQKQQELRQHAAGCLPRPACLDSKPSCLLPQPAEGWCPATPSPITSFSPRPSPSASPRPSCRPRPACLNTYPRCLLAEPREGWCPPITSPNPTNRACAQVITPARNPYSGQCLNFPTSCIPNGWMKVASCNP